ncbi:uncharacterized protein BXZ73DRAFT_89312 [Epithele typhae]|uniref:uncharacterized protein n=1 Tax=Epithele typhae TaxID=378194 RepID=UPI0020083749|nr:uncharacterized protein BXZ73DRAFT_89312 [Epithele typhae]KAH9936823.1 hypothetical protein BXZ73DRAFT_89312 [Epithele typhae]
MSLSFLPIPSIRTSAGLASVAANTPRLTDAPTRRRPTWFATRCHSPSLVCAGLSPQWHLYVNHTILFCTYILPRRLYLYSLLHLPALYWQRVARIFEDAEVSRHEVQRLVDACGDVAMASTVDAALASGYATPPQGVHRALSRGIPFPEEWEPPVVSPALARFKISWEQFIDSLLREWKTLNLVSALLLATILTIFQIQDAANDPLTRWASLMSLVFAIWSLCYGCVYIVQFNTMRSMDKASRWAEEAQRTRAAVFWNIWVLLATPVVWLAWSMIAFCIAILSFIWRTGSTNQTNGYPPLTPEQALGPRVAISAVFLLGLFNFWMILRSFSRYTHTSVRRDRRSRFGRGDRDDERGRGRVRNEDRDRMHGKVVAAPEPRNAVGSIGLGLGLSGLGGEAGSKQGSPATGGVILENVDLEKGEAVYLAGDRLAGGQLPRVSPKL